MLWCCIVIGGAAAVTFFVRNMSENYLDFIPQYDIILLSDEEFKKGDKNGLGRDVGNTSCYQR